MDRVVRRLAIALCAAVVTLLPAAAVGRTASSGPQPFTLVARWGSSGAGDGQLDFPTNLAFDRAGNVYVADRDNYRIQKFGPEGKFIAAFGGRGAGDGQFEDVEDVQVDAIGNIYAADARKGEIQVLGPGGTFVRKWGKRGNGPGELGNRLNIALDGRGNLYVADGGNHRIAKFRTGGTLVREWGTRGSGDGQLETPAKVATDRAGNVYVVERDNDRVQKFTAEGAFVARWGGEGAGDGQLRSPRGIAVDRSGNVWVSDDGNLRVQKFDAGGRLLAKLVRSPGLDFQPVAVNVDARGFLYVVDARNDQILKLKEDTAAPRLVLRGPTAQRVLKQGGVVVFVRASDDTARNLAIRASGSLRLKSLFKLREVSQTVASGVLTKITLKLSGSALRRIRKTFRAGGRVRSRAVVKVSATDSAGRTTSRNRRIGLKP